MCVECLFFMVVFVCFVLVGSWGLCVVFFQAEDGIRVLVRSRGFGDVYKRRVWLCMVVYGCVWLCMVVYGCVWLCMVGLLYVSVAAVDLLCVYLGGRRFL